MATIPVLARGIGLGVPTGNDFVKVLQQSLTDVALAVGDPQLDPQGADGKFGSRTDAAVRRFESEFIGRTATGVVDRDFQNLLDVALANSGFPTFTGRAGFIQESVPRATVRTPITPPGGEPPIINGPTTTEIPMIRLLVIGGLALLFLMGREQEK